MKRQIVKNIDLTDEDVSPTKKAKPKRKPSFIDVDDLEAPASSKKVLPEADENISFCGSSEFSDLDCSPAKRTKQSHNQSRSVIQNSAAAAASRNADGTILGRQGGQTRATVNVDRPVNDDLVNPPIVRETNVRNIGYGSAEGSASSAALRKSYPGAVPLGMPPLRTTPSVVATQVNQPVPPIPIAPRQVTKNVAKTKVTNVSSASSKYLSASSTRFGSTSTEPFTCSSDGEDTTEKKIDTIEVEENDSPPPPDVPEVCRLWKHFHCENPNCDKGHPVFIPDGLLNPTQPTLDKIYAETYENAPRQDLGEPVPLNRIIEQEKIGGGKGNKWEPFDNMICPLFNTVGCFGDILTNSEKMQRGRARGLKLKFRTEILRNYEKKRDPEEEEQQRKKTVKTVFTEVAEDRVITNSNVRTLNHSAFSLQCPRNRCHSLTRGIAAVFESEPGEFTKGGLLAWDIKEFHRNKLSPHGHQIDQVKKILHKFKQQPVARQRPGFVEEMENTFNEYIKTLEVAFGRIAMDEKQERIKNSKTVHFGKEVTCRLLDRNELPNNVFRVFIVRDQANNQDAFVDVPGSILYFDWSPWFWPKHQKLQQLINSAPRSRQHNMLEFKIGRGCPEAVCEPKDVERFLKFFTEDNRMVKGDIVRTFMRILAHEFDHQRTRLVFFNDKQKGNKNDTNGGVHIMKTANKLFMHLGPDSSRPHATEFIGVLFQRKHFVCLHANVRTYVLTVVDSLDWDVTQEQYGHVLERLPGPIEKYAYWFLADPFYDCSVVPFAGFESHEVVHFQVSLALILMNHVSKPFK